ncbi:MAG TPA: Rpn family recombination-promoting nuclease/putative transposase [Gammaproteobacteria bacterium]|nr:Rpn family recombination-promoting nuclease/putative transposase [Gammaproteobacteria bacterium]
MGDHDHAYKLLFSHAEMVRDLLEGFIKEPWLRELDYSTLEKVPGSYVSDDLRERSDDLVWRVRWAERWVYVYLLLEFQSTVEPYMAVRVQTYVGLLYQDLIRGRQLGSGGRLPPVLPIVLYNGAVRWSAPKTLAALVEPGPPALQRYQPRARYLLIDEGRYVERDLAAQRNLVAALFRLETSRSDADVLTVLRSLVEWLSRPEQASLRNAFGVWINKVILRRTPGGPVDHVEDLRTMGTLIEARMQEWEQKWLREGVEQGREQGREQGIEQGREQGIEQGREQGLREGEAQLLTRLLRRRFGELPEWVESRLRAASPEQLERWAERLLDAQSLDVLLVAEITDQPRS